jgi:hypothetical protein
MEIRGILQRLRFFGRSRAPAARSSLRRPPTVARPATQTVRTTASRPPAVRRPGRFSSKAFATKALRFLGEFTVDVLTFPFKMAGIGAQPVLEAVDVGRRNTADLVTKASRATKSTASRFGNWCASWFDSGNEVLQTEEPAARQRAANAANNRRLPALPLEAPTPVIMPPDKLAGWKTAGIWTGGAALLTGLAVFAENKLHWFKSGMAVLFPPPKSQQPQAAAEA